MQNSFRPLLLCLLLASGATVRAESKAGEVPDPQLPSASAEVRHVARWVIASGDNRGLPFLLIDKVEARVFAFDRTGKLLDSAPALLGMARGDYLLAANDVAVEALPPEQRITPAGRFVSRLALDSKQQELLVLDYEASISLHPVVTNKPEERRVERLQTATAQDNRISRGCINVPADFYAKVVSPAFTHTRGVVYVLPEAGPASELFGFQAADAADAAVAESPASNAGGGQSGSSRASQ